MWPDRRLIDLFGIEFPIVLAPMAGVMDADLIAVGGIDDGRGIAAAFALGAAGVQIGSAYLRCPESKVTALARAALAQGRDDATVITNVMTGRPARGLVNRIMGEVGPISPDAPGISPCRDRFGAA
jgi:nitronate monooxygenase